MTISTKDESQDFRKDSNDNWKDEGSELVVSMPTVSHCNVTSSLRALHKSKILDEIHTMMHRVFAPSSQVINLSVNSQLDETNLQNKVLEKKNVL